jgi:hypothetical protein
MSLRGFVALVRADGYQAIPIVANTLAEAQATAGGAGDVVAVLDQTNVTALGMALAMARASIDQRVQVEL